MFWKVFLFAFIAMPVLMLAFFVVALAAPQLGLFNGTAMLWGAIIAFIVALPISWYVANQVTGQKG